MYKLWWRFRAGLDKFIYGERTASWIRLAFVLSLTLTLTFFGYLLFEKPLPDYWVPQFKVSMPIFSWVTNWIAHFFHFVVYGFRHLIIPLGAVIGIILASAFYVQDVYELKKFKSGLRYILAAFMGLGYPNLKISEGKKQIPKDEENLIDIIGGPGYVHIRPGNVVLFESLRAPSSVRADTFNFISRFETVKEIVSLEDQHGFIEQVGAKTKDGIEVVVRDIHFRYRLRTGRRYGDHERRKAQNPYPFSVEAVRHMAYNRTVGVNRTTFKPELTSWHQTVRLVVDGGITDYIKAHKFDQLTAPNFEDANPRADIAEAMNSGIRHRLRGFGAELLWFDIGHFDVEENYKEAIRMKEIVEGQRVDTWSARWDGDAMVVRSYGEARRLAYQDMGRAEGQADLLLSIIQALEEVGFEEGFTEGDRRKQRLHNLRAIIWARVAQILDALSDETHTDSQNMLPPG